MLARRSPPRPSRIYPVLWRFASERQRIYFRRIVGDAAPWTDDAVLSAYRFTNAFRAADRVSQYLIRLAYADPEANADTLFLRIILFKLFNRIDTWDEIVRKLGPPVARRFDYAGCEALLAARRRAGIPNYSAAYIMPTDRHAGVPKHAMHLRLLREMLKHRLPTRLARTRSLRDAYALLVAQPTFGPFLALQYTIDLNYTTLMSHSEQEFVVAGPGALDGLAKCFDSLGEFTPADAITWLTERQDREFERHEISFNGLWGRSLQPIDVQNLLCEVSKYTRVAHPEIKGRSGRTRIKQRFRPAGTLPRPFFPPKWKLNRRIDQWLRGRAVTSGHSTIVPPGLPSSPLGPVPRSEERG